MTGVQTCALPISDAEKVRVLAQAEAERMKIQAEAAASHNRVALDRMLIDQLPSIVREAASGLAQANINVLNGADGLAEIAAGLVGQGLTIFESVRRNVSETAEPAELGTVGQREVASPSASSTSTSTDPPDADN